MKISLITRHAVSNYGSLLQTYATQTILERLGYNCEIVDYIRYDEHYKTLEKTELSKKPEWNNNKIKKLIYLALRQPEAVMAGKNFQKQRKKLLKLSKTYSSLEELKKNKPTADIYMTGSDQVWGPVGANEIDGAYLLAFTDDNDKRVSYGASFGKTEFDQKTKDFFKEYLSRYKAISVREDKACEIINSLDLTATQVLDPTLLLDEKEWSKNLTYSPKGDYILVYQLHNSERFNNYVKRISKETKYKIIRISPFLHQITRCGKLVYLPNAFKTLSLIKNAKCLVTDSFHATAFAINFNTSFVNILPTVNQTQSRNLSILQLTHLNDRILVNDNDTDLVNIPVDFTYCNQVLKAERERSIEILKKMLD